MVSSIESLQSNELPNPTYHTQYTKPNLLNQIYQTKPTKLNLSSKIFEMKKQIYQTLTFELNQAYLKP